MSRTGGPVRRGGGIGIVGVLVILGLMFFFGIDPSVLIQGGGPGGIPEIGLPQSRPDATTFPPSGGRDAGLQRPKTASNDDLKSFVSVVLATTEDSWEQIFRGLGQRYRDPKLVLFSGSVRSACGTGMSAMGPFYCPGDEKVYIDLDFYRELKERFHAPGDFAQAYVIAHEVGHHVRNLLGIADEVEAARRRMGKSASNALQVRMELQADCFAGIWAHQIEADKGLIERGDDRIQKQTQGYVVPDSFTHGSSAQRARWFRRGYEKGNLQACDTFKAGKL